MTSIIVDCDPGHDDAVALLLALGSDEVELLGVTTVAGNQTLEKTTANAIRVLDYVGHSHVPVAAGAGRPLVRSPHVASDVHGDTGLDGAELPPAGREPLRDHAIDWMARTLSTASSPVTVVATGPLTNVALLLARYPELEGQLDRIVLMGGAIGEGNITPAAEFNIWADPEAARRVFSSSVTLTMVGLDVTHRALITLDHLETLAGTGSAGRVVADLYKFFIPAHRQRYGWDGAPIHDAVAMAHVIDDAILTTKHLGVVIDTGPEPSRGRTYVDRWRQAGWEPNCQVALEVDADRFLTLLVERIARLG
jgi:inosine-uridine nucleoside N-ribohydrolase